MNSSIVDTVKALWNPNYKPVFDPAKVDYSTIPAEMKDAARWVCWVPDKTPINPHRGCGAKTNDPKTWGTFAQAAAQIGHRATYTGRNGAETSNICGVGFVLGDGWTGIDLDGGDAHGGGSVDFDTLLDFAATGTYTEYSKSGEGFHLIGKYHGEPFTKCRTPGIEIYTGGRYFATTGTLLPGAASQIADITEPLKQLYKKYFTAEEPQKPPPVAQITPPTSDASIWLEDTRNHITEILSCFDPSNTSDWQYIGVAMFNIGCSLDAFDSWSKQAGDRYGGRNQIERWWNHWSTKNRSDCMTECKKLRSKAKERGLDLGMPEELRKARPAQSTVQPTTEKQPEKPEGWKAQALYSKASVIYIASRLEDAKAIEKAGAPCVALISPGNVKKLLQDAEKAKPAGVLVLALGDSEAEKKAETQIRQGLQRLNLHYMKGDICCGYKTPADAMQGDAEAFTSAIQKFDTLRPENVLNYLSHFMSSDIQDQRDTPSKLTGYKTFDEATGGVYPGLYTLAATTSLGKTTFVHQMADQLAAAGHEVIYFSLEQSKFELVSKSLSRITFQTDSKNAVGSLDIRNGHLTDAVCDAVDRYKATVGGRLSIIEGNFATDLDYIKDYIIDYSQRTSSRPVAIIDYVQIVQPSAEYRRMDRREFVGVVVSELKRLSRNLGITILIISSINRANYTAAIDFESLKESGELEYGSDVVLGLDLQCLNEKLFAEEKRTLDKRERIKAAKAEVPRKIQLTMLKNRYGKTNQKFRYDYYCGYDTYCDRGEIALNKAPKEFEGKIV